MFLECLNMNFVTSDLSENYLSMSQPRGIEANFKVIKRNDNHNKTIIISYISRLHFKKGP